MRVEGTVPNHSSWMLLAVVATIVVLAGCTLPSSSMTLGVDGPSERAIEMDGSSNALAQSTSAFATSPSPVTISEDAATVETAIQASSTNLPLAHAMERNDLVRVTPAMVDHMSGAFQNGNTINYGDQVQAEQQIVVSAETSDLSEVTLTAAAHTLAAISATLSIQEAHEKADEPPAQTRVASEDAVFFEVTSSNREAATSPQSATATLAASASPTIGRAILHNSVLCPEGVMTVPSGATLVGNSAVCSIPIVSYQLGNGARPLIMVGGVHGGYEWNSILLAYEMLDYLRANPGLIPPSVTIHLIPNANPDGLYAVTNQSGRFTREDIVADTVAGRFNGRNVDLNRNWDCNWSPVALWRDNEISGGTAPFSERENQALRQFILQIMPTAALFWHSAATGVYAAGCGEPDPASTFLAQIYAHASGYPLYQTFDHYQITGDASDWLASQGIPSFTVELSTHETLDWDMNVAGLSALLQHLADSDPGSG